MKSAGLSNKRVIVTGAAAGIGRATALRFAEEGARVAAWDINQSAGTAVLDKLRQLGVEALFQRVDVTDAKAIGSAVEQIVSEWGGVDVLINNAGITRDAQLVKWREDDVAAMMSDEAFDQVMSVNLRGVFLCTRTVVPHMIRGGGGVILNASSVVALNGNFGQTNYAAAKAGVIAFAQTWARELGKYNIRVNAVAPGFIDTAMARAIPGNILDTMKAHTPLRRFGAPEDVANAYVWLASDQASFVHGAVLSVDGGLVLGT